MEPHSEADPVALLVSLLCAFGNAADRRTHYMVSADRHGMNLFASFVGDSSKSRKGMSWNYVESLLKDVEESWASNRVVSGLSSGEGLIHHVRDRREKPNEDGEIEVVDEGVSDKRLLSVEGELASLLKVMARQGSTMSAVARNAWDGKKLQNLTKNSPDSATNAHVSIIGHITKAELLRYLTETEAANGFANRFMWFMVRKSKILPFGSEWKDSERKPFVERLKAALRFAARGGVIGWSESGAAVWSSVYGTLSEGKPGMFGSIVARGEAQAVRLATIYAVLDQSGEIRREHILAALAVWDYAEESARYIFGDASGDPEADAILDALRNAGTGGLTRTPTKPHDDRTMWRRLIAQAHPDAGGDHELFIWTGALKDHVCIPGGFSSGANPGDKVGSEASEEKGSEARRGEWSGPEDPDRIPYPPYTDFREATLSALRYANNHPDKYGRLLQYLEDCYSMSEKWREQELGASYRRLAAIGHMSGMDTAQRSRWYDIARSIPLADRHAGHILSRLKRLRREAA
jgi:hypothetical protein